MKKADSEEIFFWPKRVPLWVKNQLNNVFKIPAESIEKMRLLTQTVFVPNIIIFLVDNGFKEIY